MAIIIRRRSIKSMPPTESFEEKNPMFSASAYLEEILTSPGYVFFPGQESLKRREIQHLSMQDFDAMMVPFCELNKKSLAGKSISLKESEPAIQLRVAMENHRNFDGSIRLSFKIAGRELAMLRFQPQAGSTLRIDAYGQDKELLAAMEEIWSRIVAQKGRILF